MNHSRWGVVRTRLLSATPTAPTKRVQERSTSVRGAWFSPSGAGMGNVHRCLIVTEHELNTHLPATAGYTIQSEISPIFHIFFAHSKCCRTQRIRQFPRFFDSRRETATQLTAFVTLASGCGVALKALSYFRLLPTCNPCTLVPCLSSEVVRVDAIDCQGRSLHRALAPIATAA